MRVWSVEDANRLLLLRQLVRSVAFEIRVGITPAHGFLQLMAYESKEEQQAVILRVMHDRLQEVEVIIQKLILTHTEKMVVSPVADCNELLEEEAAIRSIATIRETIASVHRELLNWQVDGDITTSPKRLAVMLQGLWQAEKVCRGIMDMASLEAVGGSWEVGKGL